MPATVLSSPETIDSVARTFYVTAWASAWERAVEEGLAKSTPWGPGAELFDFAPATPATFKTNARKFILAVKAANPGVNWNALQLQSRLDDNSFGYYMAMEGIGEGVGLWEYVPRGAYRLPRVESYLDAREVMRRG